MSHCSLIWSEMLKSAISINLCEKEIDYDKINAEYKAATMLNLKNICYPMNGFCLPVIEIPVISLKEFR